MELNILLVDDEYFVLKGMEIMLGEQTEFPVKIMTAMDAVDAFDRLSSFRPDVIIADVNMPEIDGLSMLERLSPDSACKYIIVSGYEDQEYLKRALRLHVADYLTKPVDKDYLIQRLKEIFEEKKNRLFHTWMKLRMLLFSGGSDSRTAFSSGELEQFFPFPHLFLCAAALDPQQAEQLKGRLSGYFESVHLFSQNSMAVFLFNYSASIRITDILSILAGLLPSSFGFSAFTENSVTEMADRLFLHYQEALCHSVLAVLPVSEDTRDEICGLIVRRTLQPAISVIRFDLAVSDYINGIYENGFTPQEKIGLLVFTEALAAYLLIAGIRLPDGTVLQLYQTQLPSVRDKHSLSGFLERLVLDTQYVVFSLMICLWSLLFIIPVVCFRFWKLWKLRSQLAAGIPLDAGHRYPRSLARTIAFFVVPTVLVCAAFLSIFIPPAQRTALTPDQPTPAPLVSLYDLELDPAIQDPEFVHNSAETSFSPLAVKQDLNQWTDWEEPDDPTASISIDYVDAVSPTFAGWVLDSWKRTDEVEDGIPWQEASRPGLDRLYTYIEVPEGPAEYDVGDHHYTVNQFADTYYWLGQAGNQVFRLTVRGTVPPEEALDLLLERMSV